MGADHLFGRDRKEGTGLYGSVVGDDHPITPGNPAGTDHRATGRGTPLLPVHLPTGKAHELDERAPLIDQSIDTFTGRQTVLDMLPAHGLLAAPFGELRPSAGKLLG